MRTLELTEGYIHDCLSEASQLPSARGDFRSLFPDPPRPAAVLVPLLRTSSTGRDSDTWHLLLTRRSDTLEEHRGQVAFPGGQAHEEDPSPVVTALRETQEEIGLDPNSVRILGQLNSFLTITNYHVTPIVGVIPWPFPVSLAEHEVSRVFTIPLEWLAEPANHEVRQRVIPPPYSTMLHTESYPVIYFHPYDGEILWGVSAEITMSLLRAIIKKETGG